MNPYFGEPWGAPAIDANTQVPTPVGMACLWCAVPIEDGDRGYMVGCVSTGADGKPYARVEPAHRECHLRAVVGSAAHLDGACTCHGAGPDDGPQTPADRRAEAIEVWDRVQSGAIGRRRASH